MPIRRAAPPVGRLSSWLVRAIKETVEKCSGQPFETAFKIENEAQRFIRKTEDAREGPRAFIEKRKPNYKGR